MQPYWIKIEQQPVPTFLNLGVGITARNEADARQLFVREFGNEYIIESISRVERVDQLEQNHVAPNIGNMLVRGIWFPNLGPASD
jgi:hypothetical protein